MSKPKQKITRDKAALENTLNYLIHTRKFKQTSVGLVAKHFGISGATAGQRLTRLQALGQAEKLGRGFYRAVEFPTIPPDRQLPSGTPSMDELLIELRAERERVERQIASVEEVIRLQEARRAAKGNGG